MNKILRIHIFQHVSFEGPAAIEDWTLKNGHSLSYTRFYNNDTLPQPDEIDWLIIMGGPMGVYDHNLYPWLKSEVDFVRNAIAVSKVVIGICLGAQIIASALGTRVYRGSFPEIGWFPVTFNRSAADQSGFGFLSSKAIVFHWHQDTFDIPEGATILASSEAFPNQAFIYGHKVLALQFHFEVDYPALEKMINNGSNELIAGDFVQTSGEILKQRLLIAQNNQILFQLLDTMANTA